MTTPNAKPTVQETNPRIVLRDSQQIWKLRCPSCGIDGEIDDDQLHGKVSTWCECGFHETRNWFREEKL